MARAALLKSKKLLGTEGFIVDLRGSFDQILEVSTCEEVSEVDKFAMGFILHINDSPSVLATTDLLASNNN